jgi:hypothetical protein
MVEMKESNSMKKREKGSPNTNGLTEVAITRKF